MKHNAITKRYYQYKRNTCVIPGCWKTVDLPFSGDTSDDKGYYSQWNWFYPTRVLPMPSGTGTWNYMIKVFAEDSSGNTEVLGPYYISVKN